MKGKKLNALQGLALRGLIDELRDVTGMDQAELVEAGNVRASDVSKLKSGAGIGPKKWKDLLERLAAIVEDKSKIPTSRRSRLRSLLTDLTGTTGEAYPSSRTARNKELERADRALHFFHYLQLGDETPSRWAQVETQDLYLVVSKYMGAVGEALGEHLPKAVAALPSDRPDRKLRILEGEDYLSLLGLSRIITAPVLCTFPYFLTRSRRKFWGVVPYASHARLGMVVERRVLTLTYRNNIPVEFNPRAFAHLLSRGDVYFHTLSGYAAEEILCDMAIDLATRDAITEHADAQRQRPPMRRRHQEPGTSDLLRMFNTRVSTSHQSLEDVLHQYFGSEPLERRRQSDTRPEGEFHAMVFDLADLPSVTATLADPGRSNAVVTTIRHEQEVPVGIGFSLPAFRWLSSGSRFSRLRVSALAVLEPFREELRQVGIELEVEEATRGAGKERPKAQARDRRRRDKGVDGGTRRSAGSR